MFPGSGKSANYIPCPGGGTRSYQHFQPDPLISPGARTMRHSWKTRERLLGVLRHCRPKTDPPQTQNTATRLTVCGRFGVVLHAAACFHRCSLAGGRPLITSPVQGEALNATFISSPTPLFPGSPHWETLVEDTRRSPRMSQVLQTENRTSPHSNSETRMSVWGRFGASIHAAAWCHRCSLAVGSPLITSPVQGDALDATCISSRTPAFPRESVLGDPLGRTAKGS